VAPVHGQDRGRRRVPGVLGQLVAGEQVGLDLVRPVAPAARPEDRPLVGARALAVAVTLLLAEAQTGGEPLAQVAGLVAEHAAAGAEAAHLEGGPAPRLVAQQIGYQVDRAADRRHPAHAVGHPALDLHVLEARGEVRQVDPVDLVVLGIVLRHAVDQHGDAPLVEAADLQVGVAQAAARIAVGEDAGDVLQEQGQVGGRLAAAQVQARQVGMAEVHVGAVARSGDHDAFLVEDRGVGCGTGHGFCGQAAGSRQDEAENKAK